MLRARWCAGGQKVRISIDLLWGTYQVLIFAQIVRICCARACVSLPNDTCNPLGRLGP